MPKAPEIKVNQSAVYPLAPSTLEGIDEALYNYINDELNIFCTTNDGFVKVPVNFSSAERSFQIKNDPTLREKGQTLKYPLISISKNSITNNPETKGRYGVNIPPYFASSEFPASIDIARVVNQDKTKNFANANAIRKSASGVNANYQTFPIDNKEIVYETLSVPMPTFVEVVYGINLISNFQEQMNEMLSPFLTKHSTPAVFPIYYQKNRYEAFIEQDYGIESNPQGLNLEERVFKSTVTIRVLGHLIGAEKNQDSPNVVVQQSAAKVVIQREHVIVGDSPELETLFKSKYRP